MEFNEELTTSIWNVQSAGYMVERAGMCLKHLLFLVQPPRASEKRGAASWIATLSQNGIFIPLSDTELAMLEKI